MGNKSKVIKYIAPLFPKAENFYDLFGGGFAVTHYMLLHRGGDFRHFHFNEIRPGICELIKDAIAGKYAYANFRPRWISREEFHQNKDKCAYTKMIWSFGNKGESYLFGDTTELKKQSLHRAVIFGEFDDFAKSVLEISEWPASFGVKDRRLYCRKKVVARKGELQQLERLERLQQLQQLERLQQLTFYNGDYRSVEIKENSVVYCDIPYKGTAGYDKNASFNHDEFFDWAASIRHPVFISEYHVSDDRFTLIKEVEARSTLSASKNNKKCVERIYCNKEALLRINHA
jgi:site-specific DNA-adenine methylase